MANRYTLFMKFSTIGKEELWLLIVYADDVILRGDYVNEMERLKKCLGSNFKIKDLDL